VPRPAVQPPGRRPDLDTPACHVEFDTSAGGLVIVSSELILYGWSIVNESTTTEAEVDLYDNTSAQAIPVWPVTLLPQESSREWFGDRGIWLRRGLYAAAAIGAVKGAVFWLPAAR
jgi:hypothetical protein